MERIEEEIENVKKMIEECKDSEVKKLLMKKEVQLREKELILLRRGAGNSVPTGEFILIALYLID